MQHAKRYTKWIVAGLSILVTVGLLVGAATAEENKDALFARLRAVYDAVESVHKDGADINKFIDGAIKGGLEALGDPYTTYFPPSQYKAFVDSLNGTFTGIGAYLELEGNFVVVASPIKGTPAEQAGLEPGDRILEADGTSLIGAATEQAVKLIRGPAGTAVTLKIERPAEKRTFTVKITRAVITIPEVESKMLDSTIGYIKLSTFGDDAAQGFFSAVQDLKARGATGLILDLRQNGGGYLDSAVQIASGFVPRGQVVVWEVGKSGKSARRSTGRLINMPTAVLVDKGSASASEVLAGAIQDYETGVLVGTKTFGKGTVQNLSSMSTGAGIKVTIAEYLTPKERRVHGIGLTPEVVTENPRRDAERTSPLELKRELKLGDVGLDVLSLQQRLADLGYKTDTDGFFGFGTFSAARAFAKDHGLREDGVITTAVVAVLNEKVAEANRKFKNQDAQLDKALEVVRSRLK